MPRAWARVWAGKLLAACSYAGPGAVPSGSGVHVHRACHRRRMPPTLSHHLSFPHSGTHTAGHPGGPSRSCRRHCHFSLCIAGDPAWKMGCISITIRLPRIARQLDSIDMDSACYDELAAGVAVLSWRVGAATLPPVCGRSCISLYGDLTQR